MSTIVRNYVKRNDVKVRACLYEIKVIWFSKTSPLTLGVYLNIFIKFDMLGVEDEELGVEVKIAQVMFGCGLH